MVYIYMARNIFLEKNHLKYNILSVQNIVSVWPYEKSDRYSEDTHMTTAWGLQ